LGLTVKEQQGIVVGVRGDIEDVDGRVPDSLWELGSSCGLAVQEGSFWVVTSVGRRKDDG
jgi:hypothetical protein